MLWFHNWAFLYTWRNEMDKIDDKSKVKFDTKNKIS